MSGNPSIAEPSPIIEVGGHPHQPPTSAKDNLFRRVRQLKKLVMHRAKSGQTNKSTKNQTEEELFEQSTRGERRRQQECGGQVDENFGDSYEEASGVYEVGAMELNQPAATLEEQLPEQLDRVLALSESSELPNLKTPIFSANHHQRSKQKNNLKTEALSPFTADLLSLRRKRQQIRNNLQKSGLAQPTIVPSTTTEPALSHKAHERSTISSYPPNQSHNCHHNRTHHRKRVYKKVQAESSETEKVEVDGQQFFKDWNQKCLDPMPIAYHQHNYNPYYGPYGPAAYPYSNCYYHHHYHPFVGSSHPMESYSGYPNSAGAGVGAPPTQPYGPYLQAAPPPPYGPWLQPYQPYPPISVHPFYSNCLNPGNPLARSSHPWYPSNLQPTNPVVSTDSVSSNFATPASSGPVQDFAINSRYLSKKEDKLVSKFVGTSTQTPPTATSSGDKSKQQLPIVGPELLMENSTQLFQQPTEEVKSQNSFIYPRFDVSTRRDSILAQILEGDQFVIDEQLTDTNRPLHWSIEN